MRFPEIPGYQYEGLLGEDPFGWTFVASHEGGKHRVIKVFKAQATSDRFIRQYFKAFSGPSPALAGVAPIYDFVMQGPQSLAACAVPFYGMKGRANDQWKVSSLKRLMHLLSREQSLEIVREMAVRLGEIHEAGLFHGGIRPSGIFLMGGSKGGQKVRFSDFGEIFMGGLQFLEAGELLFYTSPEQLASGDYSNDLGKRWDVYAFGVIAFELLTGHLPRLDQLRQQCVDHPEWMQSTPAITFGELTSVSEHFLAQLDAERSVEWPDDTSDPGEASLRAIIGQCLLFNPEERPASLDEVAARIQKGSSAAPKDGVTEPALQLVKAPESAAGANEDFDGPPVFEEIASKAKVAGRPFLTSIRESPVVRWQITAVATLLAMLPLSAALVVNYFKLKEIEAERAVEVSELAEDFQSKVNNQAAEFIKTIREKEQLESSLNNLEKSEGNLMGQAKLARQILRQTQENGDQFFRLVLDNRDSDVKEFREGRANALLEGRKHYERLVEAYGDASDFIVSTANAFFYLGRIYKEMGEFGKALASFGEAERRYSALLEDSSTSNPEFVKNIAFSKNALGLLAIKSGQYSVARSYFTESSRFWTELRSQSPTDGLTAALNIHQNSLSIVDCEFAMDRLDAALDGAASIGVQLTELQKQLPDDHRIIAAIAKSFTLTGRVLEARQENELAKEAYQQSSDLFAKAVSLDSAVDDYQLGLGNSLARVGLLSNDFEKLEGAAGVLSAVVAANPYESTYLKTLADIYGALANKQRDGGQLKNAIVLDEEAITTLKPIIEGNSAVASDVLFSYSQRLAHLAELLGDSGKFDESRIPLKEAIAVLERISKSDPKIAEYHRSLAKVRGMVGFAFIKTGDNTEAKEHLELARTEWENFIVSNPEDADAAQAVKWTSEQLKRLP